MASHILEQIIPERESHYYNQIESFPGLPTLGTRLCGATAIGMVIGIDPIEVVRTAVGIQRIPPEWGGMSVGYHPVNVNDNGLYFIIPIGEIDSHTTEVIAKEIAADSNQKAHLELFEYPPIQSHRELGDIRKSYLPVLSLGRGLDWRGFGQLMSALGHSGIEIGDLNSDKLSLDTILSYLADGHQVLSSVNHTKDSSHIVLLGKTRKRLLHRPEIRVSDPLENEPKWVDATSWWNDSFRGYGGVIYKK